MDIPGDILSAFKKRDEELKQLFILLKELKKLVPEGCFQLVLEHGIDVFLEKALELPREIHDKLVDNANKRKDTFHFELQDGRWVYAMPVKEINAVLIFTISNHTPDLTFRDYNTVLIQLYVDLFLSQKAFHNEQKLRNVQKKQLDRKLHVLENMYQEILEDNHRQHQIIQSQQENYSLNLKSEIDKQTAEHRKVNAHLHEKTEDLKRSQAQLIQSEKMASLGQLVAGVAHEINTPVGIGVTVSSHLTKSTQKIISSFENNKMTKGDLTKHFSSTLESSELILQHLLQTADLIKSFKMVTADQTAHEKREFNVKSYLGDIILSLRPKLKNKPHQIKIDCDDDIEIDSYPGALAQIVTNMVLNSLTHAFNEGDNGTMAIEVLKNANEIILKYSDDGKGATEENIEKIFEPFFTTKRGEGGTGLGMHIVYNTVTQILKGSISCESIQGQGISFFINLPAKLEN